ncbi:hypothetical protein AAG906_039682 [Vitis piasezkii]
MAELPLHIMENILLRSPVKSLIPRTRFCILDYSERGNNHSMVVRASTKDCEAFSDDDADLANKIVLWNPSTRQCNQLPPNPNVLDFLGCHGFGYDSFADDYKIFVVSMLDPNIETVVDVFSLKSNKWKRIQEKHHTRVAYMSYDPIHDFDTIMAFDFEKEQFRELAIPREEEESIYPSKMWVMKEYGVDTSWSKMASPYNSRRNNLNEEFKCYLLHTLNNEHLLLDNKEKLVLCDLKENT